MGVPTFFRWLVQKFPLTLRPCKEPYGAEADAPNG